MRSRLFVVVVLVAVLAAACGGSDPTSGTDPAPREPATASPATGARCEVAGSVADLDVRYASTPGVAADLQSLDLYRPERPKECPATPIVVYVHGGGFRVGDKSNRMNDKVNLFTGAGWAFASVNYRLVGSPGAGPTNGVYPAAEEDVAAAIAFLADHHSEYGLDAHRIMLLGHSAGAFLVSLVSTDDSFLEAAGVPLSDVVCTVSLDTTYDIPTKVANGGMNAAMYRNAFGDDAAVWAKGSPRRNVTAEKEIPAFHVVTRGAPRRIADAQAFGAVLNDAGVAADVQVATGLTHEEVNAFVGRPGDTFITPVLMSFYERCAGERARAG